MPQVCFELREMYRDVLGCDFKFALSNSRFDTQLYDLGHKSLYLDSRIWMEFFDDCWMAITDEQSTKTYGLPMYSFSKTMCGGEINRILMRSSVIKMSIKKENALIYQKSTCPY